MGPVAGTVAEMDFSRANNGGSSSLRYDAAALVCSIVTCRATIELRRLMIFDNV